MVEIGRFDDDSSKIRKAGRTVPNNNLSAAKKRELNNKIIAALNSKEKAEVSENTLKALNSFYLKYESKNSDIYAQRVFNEETNINNIIDRGKEPLKYPNEKPTFVKEQGPHGGKLEQFPQRANGTYRTIETLPSGQTYECTYSQTGTLLNEINRNENSTQITTYTGNLYDRVTITPLNGKPLIGKIQAGNFTAQEPPTLQDVTGKPLNGFLIK